MEGLKQGYLQMFFIPLSLSFVGIYDPPAHPYAEQ